MGSDERNAHVLFTARGTVTRQCPVYRPQLLKRKESLSGERNPCHTLTSLTLCRWAKPVHIPACTALPFHLVTRPAPGCCCFQAPVNAGASLARREWREPTIDPLGLDHRHRYRLLYSAALHEDPLATSVHCPWRRDCRDVLGNTLLCDHPHTTTVAT